MMVLHSLMITSQTNSLQESSRRSIQHKMASEDEVDSDEELDDSDGQPLRRFPGQYRRVSAQGQSKVWEIDGLMQLDDKMELKDVLKILDKEQDIERKRRMSMPYSSDKEITDLHIQNRTRRLSDLHEELFKLFSINIAVNRRKFEKQRMVAEANKQLMHEELLRKSMIKAINEAVEIERQERIKTLQQMAEGNHSCIYEVADTNAKLSNVHKELKRIFKRIEENSMNYEDNPLSERESVKSRLGGISKRKLSKEIDEIKQRKLEDYQEFQTTNECHSIVKTKLKEVQEELKSLFDRYRTRALEEANGRKTEENAINECEHTLQNKNVDHMTASNEAKGILTEIALKKNNTQT